MVGVASLVRIWLTDRTQPADKQVIFTDDYQLSTDYDHALSVVADSANLSGDSHVEGDAALVGHDRAVVDGAVDGNLTVVGSGSLWVTRAEYTVILLRWGRTSR
jgi:hypothetical protein